MSSVSMTNSANQVKWLPIGVACVLWLWLFLLYGRSLYQITPVEFRSHWGVLGPLDLTLYFLNPVFHSLLIFMGSYVLGVGLIVWAMLKLARRVMWRLTLIAQGVIALGFPFVMPLTYGSYRIPAHAAEGYELQWVTSPENRYSSAFRQAQLVHEAECDYHLSGWSPEGDLNYTSDCLPGIWHYDLNAKQSSWSLFSNREVDSTVASITRWDGRAYLLKPRSLKGSPGSPFLTLERAVSPDGRWEAVVVRWFYGPSDIVVVGRTREDSKARSLVTFGDSN